MTLSGEFLVAIKNKKILKLRIEDLANLIELEPEEIAIQFPTPDTDHPFPISTIRGMYSYFSGKEENRYLIFVLEFLSKFYVCYFNLLGGKQCVFTETHLNSIESFTDIFDNYSALINKENVENKILSVRGRIGSNGFANTINYTVSSIVQKHFLYRKSDMPYSIAQAQNFGLEIIPGKNLFFKNLGRFFTEYDNGSQIFSIYSIGLHQNQIIVGALSFYGESDTYTHVVYDTEIHRFSLFKVSVEQENLVCKVPEKREKFKDVELEVSFLTKRIENSDIVDKSMKKITISFKPESSAKDYNGVGEEELKNLKL